MTETEWLACEDPMPMLNYLRGRASRKIRLSCIAACRHIWEGVRTYICRHRSNDIYGLDSKHEQWLETAEWFADGMVGQAELDSLPKLDGDLREFGDARCVEIFLAARYGVGLSAIAYGYAVAESYIEGAIAGCCGCVGEDDDDLLPSYTEYCENHPEKIELIRWNRREFEQALGHYDEDFEEGFRRCVIMAMLAAEERTHIWYAGREAMVAECKTQANILRDIFGNPFRSLSVASVWRTDTVLSLARAMYTSRDFSAMPILADALQDAGCDNDDILNHCRGGGTHVRGCWVVDSLLGKE